MRVVYTVALCLSFLILIQSVQPLYSIHSTLFSFILEWSESLYGRCIDLVLFNFSQAYEFVFYCFLCESLSVPMMFIECFGVIVNECCFRFLW